MDGVSKTELDQTNFDTNLNFLYGLWKDLDNMNLQKR